MSRQMHYMKKIRKIKHDLKNFLILGDDVEIKYLKRY